jgi:hypothetical protein
VQVLLSPTSWVAAGAGADAAAAAVAAAREIDHQAELELLAATAAATLGGRWSILLKEMMKILERQTTTTTTTSMSAICNSLNPPKDLLTLLSYIHTCCLNNVAKLLQQMIIHTESINQSFLCPNKQQWLIIVSWPCPVPPPPPSPPPPLKTLPLWHHPSSKPRAVTSLTS